MMRARTLALVATALAAHPAHAQDCNKMYGRRRMECIEAAAAKARARRPPARARRGTNGPDKYGRYKARLNLKGILPEVERQALPGDVIRTERGYNNVSINYRNAKDRVFGSFAGKIAPVVYDPATRHYTGWEKMLPFLYSKKTRFPNRRPGQVTIKLGKGVTFDEPLVIRISAKTTQGNSFWTERTVRVEGSKEAGFTIPGEIYLDHYSRAAGSNEPARNDPQNRGAGAPGPRPGPPPGPGAGSGPPPGPPPGGPSSGAPPKPAVRPPIMSWRPKDLKRGEIFLGGFTEAMAARLAEDPVREGRGNVRVYIKNRGAGVWGLIKKTSWRNRPIEEFSMRIPTGENSRISYDKPLVIRAEIRAQSNGRYLTEQVRTIETLSEPFVFDQFVESRKR